MYSSPELNSADIPDVFMSSAYADNSTYKDYVYDLTDADFIELLEPSALTGVWMWNDFLLTRPFAPGGPGVRR